MHERSAALGRLTYETATIKWMQEILSSPSIKSCWEDMRGIYELWGYGEFVDAVEQSP